MTPALLTGVAAISGGNFFGLALVPATATPPDALYSNAGPIDFGSVIVGSNGTQQLMLTNSGGSAFTLSGFDLTPGTSSAFVITNIVCNGTSEFPFPAGGVSVASQEVCTITLQFVPLTAGNGQTESLTVRTSTTNSNAAEAPGGNGQIIPLQGNGIAPIAASATPVTLLFGLQLDSVGAVPGIPISPIAGPPQTVTLTNTSTTGSLTGIIPTLAGANAGDFSLTGNCGTTLSPGALLNPNDTCAINVTFAPSVVGGGAESGTLSITDNASQEPQIVSLSGMGVPFVMTTPLVAAVGVLVGGSGTITFNVTLGPGPSTNTLTLSCAPLLKIAPAGAGCTPSPSSIAQNNMQQTVQVTVTFTTTGSIGVVGRPRELPPAGLLKWGPWSLIAAILLLSLWTSLGAAEQRRARAAWAFLALVVLCGAWMAACSSSSSPSTSSATPPGSYTFVVTAKLGNVTQTINLNLNVTQ